MEKKKVNSLLGKKLAQDDKNFLEYAVRRDDILDELKSPDNNFLLINAVRGSGKSGFLILLNNYFKKELDLQSQKTNVVISKNFFDVKEPSKELTISECCDIWKNIIYGWVFSYIGADTSFAFDDDSTSAVEYAERTGEKKLSQLMSMFKRFSFNKFPLELNEPESNLNEFQLQRILEKYGKTFWILLDEFDDNYENTPRKNNYLVGLLEASKNISSRFEKIKIRVTIRPHIATTLYTVCDNVQKIDDDEIRIHWTKSKLLEILHKRIIFYEKRNFNGVMHKYESNLSDQYQLPIDILLEKNIADIFYTSINRYFVDFDLKLSEKGKSKYRALKTITLGRPRWLIEFCKTALLMAKGDKVFIDDVRKALHDYGSNRIKFVIGEHRTHIPEIGFFINQLSSLKSPTIGNSNELKKLIISQIIAEKESLVDGDSLENVTINIAKSLYMIELIRASEYLGNRQDNHRFYYYKDAPSLLDSWNQKQSIIWEIHPAFARGLNIIDNKTYKDGDTVKLHSRSKKNKLKNKFT